MKPFLLRGVRQLRLLTYFSILLAALPTTGKAAGIPFPTLVNNGTGQVTVQGELKKWHKITLLIDGPASSETASDNPFLNYRLNVTFSNGSKSYLVPGYFAADGNAAQTSASAGNVWKVHFAPDEVGTWTYSVSMRTGPDLAVSEDPNAGSAVSPVDGQSGSFTIAPTDKGGVDFRGKGRLRYVGQHYLQFAETGEYFLKGGVDSPENFLAYEDFDNTPDNGGRRKTYGAHLQDWQSGDPTWKDGKGKGIIGAINYLSGQGLNAFSFLTMNINGDDRNVYPYLNTSDYTRFDCSKLEQWEKVFEHADTKGMYLHFKLQETENDKLLDGGDLGTLRKLYYRELIARFGHHLALNWNMGEENVQSDQQRKDMAEYFSRNDPYKHHITIHAGSGQQYLVHPPLLGNNSKYTGVSLLTPWNNVYLETQKWVEQSAQAGKKWIVANDEQGDASTGVAADADYSGNKGSVADNQNDIRKEVLWGNIMALGAGVEYYFGYQTGETDLTAQDFRSRAKMWRYNKYALDFFKNHAPVGELISLTNVSNGWMIGKQSDLYVVYLKNGGSTNITIFTNAIYSVKWYNPRTGTLHNGTVTSFSGLGSKSVGDPPAEPTEDWVVLVKRESEPISSCDAPFEEKNGLVVIEAENLNLPLGWQKKTGVNGYTGSGYIEWVNAANYYAPGSGIIETTVKITKTGKYHFRWHSKVGKGTSATDHNDSWLRMPDASNFYATGNRTVYPVGSGKTPTANGVGAEGWFKVYTHGTTNWTWSTNTSDTEQLQIVAEFNTPGVYRIQIAPRSDGHLINRLIMYHSSVDAATAQALSNPETSCIGDVTANKAPTVNAGADQTVSLPQNSATLTGTANDPDGSIISYQWVQTSGPNNAILTDANSNRLIASELVPGTYTFRLTVTDDKGASSVDEASVKVLSNQKVVSFTLMNADTDQPIRELTVNDVLNLATLPTRNINIRANTEPYPVGSVKFELTGSPGRIQTETGFPYALYGDNNGDFNAWMPNLGSYSLTCTPYTGAGATGAIGTALTVNFTIMDQAPNSTIENCTTPYAEQNGLLVIEAENLNLPSGWERRTTATGYTGSSYIEWVNTESLNKTGVGLIETTVKITKTGKYYFRWHNRVGIGFLQNEHNDSFLRLPDASNFYAEQGSLVVYPKGSGKLPTANGSGGDGWFKIFSSKTTDWTWSTNANDEDPYQVAAEFNTPGVYKIQISARAKGHQIDRLVMYHSSINQSTAQVLTNFETTCSAGNQPPIADAGADQTITSPANNLTLIGSARDADGTIASYQWSQVAGSNATLANASTATLTASDLVPGTYTFRLTATDNSGATATDDVIVTVLSDQRLVSFTLINADTEEPIRDLVANDLLNLATLPTRNLNIRANTSPSPVGSVRFVMTGRQNRSSNDSGLPYALYGDVNGNFNNWTPLAGTYNLTGTPYTGANVSGAAGTALTIKFDVVDQATNQSPTANAGSDQTITLPTNTVTLAGSGNDPDGSIAAHQWTQQSGPNTATLVNASTASLTANNLVAGTYVFRLTVTDNQGAASFDEVSVTVNQAANVTQQVISFTLINADSEQPIRDLVANDVLDLSTLPTRNLNIRANTEPYPVGSVKFVLSGKQSRTQNETGAPYALFGDANGNYNAWTPALGNYSLLCTPYTGASASGTAGTPLTINFSVTDLAANQAPTANAGADQTITLPANTVTLAGSGNDPDGSIAAHQWTQQSGPNTATLVNANTASLTANDL
uniref:DUF5060 domain-containing protein n=1 Tax=Telluribacter sp. SYSU D00476 TaxID=2811430 RepID=UPI001FF45A61